MTITEAYKTAFRKYAVIEGRADRMEYYTFVVASAVSFLVFDSFRYSLLGFVAAIYILVTIIPTITLQVRRLHDMNMSGLWAFLMLVPVFGSLILLIISLIPGTCTANRFGEVPNS